MYPSGGNTTTNIINTLLTRLTHQLPNVVRYSWSSKRPLQNCKSIWCSCIVRFSFIKSLFEYQMKNCHGHTDTVQDQRYIFRNVTMFHLTLWGRRISFLDSLTTTHNVGTFVWNFEEIFPVTTCIVMSSSVQIFHHTLRVLSRCEMVNLLICVSVDNSCLSIKRSSLIRELSSMLISKLISSTYFGCISSILYVINKKVHIRN